MAKLDLTKYGITGTTEVVHNPSYEQLFAEETNPALEGYEKVVAAELEIVLDIAKKYGAEDLGTEYGEKWFQNRITFFYPDNIMDLPQMFGTLDTVATHDNIEKIYRAMKAAVSCSRNESSGCACRWRRNSMGVISSFFVCQKSVRTICWMLFVRLIV